MTWTAQRLARRAQQLQAGAGETIAWIEDTARSAPRLAQEAPALVEKLRRVRNLSRRLGAAAVRPMTVGLFGLSQAGKSYLVSALAAGPNGRLETRFDGQTLDFIQHVNPPGGGSEATGLVTRFTRQASETPAGFPIRLSLVSEVDIVKILGNAFFHDFDHQKITHDLSAEHIADVLAEVETRRQAQRVPGITEDDVVDLLDYFEQRFRRSMEPLRGDYWPSVMRLAPYLAPAERARLFAPLWGEVPEMGAAYQALREALASLRFAPVVFAPLSALVGHREDGSWTQVDSVMSVAILARLGTAADDLLEVVPQIDGRPGAAVRVHRAMLTALTAELEFPLVEPPTVPVFERVDVLDFPGYRGRLKLESFDQVGARLNQPDANPIAELILRGKVAYLFERYSDSQEMNVLIVCTPSDKQSDVNDVGDVLNAWVDATQGRTPEARAARPPGLIWAITMFDKTLSAALQYTEDQLRLAWGDKGLLNRTMIEKFRGSPWMFEWRPGAAFDRVFLVRKPGWEVAFLRMAQGEELEVSPAHAPQLAAMRRSFVADETVQRHVSDPGGAWDAMLALGDGGIGRLGAHLAAISDLQVKLDRIGEQLDEAVHELCETWMGRYFQREGAGEIERKRALAQEIIAALRPRAMLIGELQLRCAPANDALRALYLRAAHEPATAPAAASAAPPPAADDDLYGGIDTGGLIDLDFGRVPAAATADALPAAASSIEARYSRAVMSEWVRHLRELGANEALLRFLGLSRRIVESLVDELVVAIDRCRLESQLVDATRRIERDAATARSRLVERQLLAAGMVIGDFLAWLGHGATPPAQRPPSEALPGRHLFEPPPPIADGELPSLGEQPLNYTGLYLVDWFTALRGVIVENAGHSAGREISAEANARLGEILQRLTAG
jgi:hypothetical protein